MKVSYVFLGLCLH